MSPLTRNFCRISSTNNRWDVAKSARGRTPQLLLALLLGCSVLCACKREQAPELGSLRLVMVGDILLADAAQPILDERGYQYPFERLTSYLTDADLVVGNLEAPITTCPDPINPGKRYNFKMSRQVPRALKNAGLDILNLANNHIQDYGSCGLTQTQESLTREGLRFFGASNPAGLQTPELIVAHGNRHIGFLGFLQTGHKGCAAPSFRVGRDVIPCIGLGVLRDLVAKIRHRVDTLVVSMHAGLEYKLVPTSLQREFAHAAIDFGADLVVGHHPHVLQGAELYRGKPIIYSLGNFTFGSEGRYDSMEDKFFHKSWIARIDFHEKEVTGVMLVPIETNNLVVNYQPFPSAKQDSQRLIRHFGNLPGNILKVGTEGYPEIVLRR